ncbi:MAG: yheD 8 [Paenibacillus sp.]|jgi:glutathione synthase/RimK-type ligase-like ATP-grasp enzyme|uniref:YheC/YheD family protein n=1 Tax=Paenibacillus sp. GCM10012303 TaxID=3317340 RepID=UPI0029ED7659|nr:yheD 8 [Paenibacillus sp.]
MRYSRNKLAKYRVLKKSSELASALPSTYSMTKSHFQKLISRYGKVIVKPSSGSGGIGVMSVVSQGGQSYKLHHGTSKKRISGLSETYAYIKRKTKGASYIVQKKIRLAKVNGRPFDARVMAQRKRGSSEWVLTGQLAKIAGAGYIITNTARSKGKVVPLSDAIRRSDVQGRSVSEIEHRVESIGLKAARQLHNYYRIRTVGLDVGIDNKGRVWIIEANFHPAKSLFLKLKNRSMYRRIVRYQK